MPQQKKISNARLDHMYFNMGMSLAECASAFGCHWVTVHKNMQKRGKKLRPPGRHKMVTINLSDPNWRKQVNARLRK